MAKISEACLAAAKDALKTFSQVDLERYVIKVFNKAREYTNLKGQSAIDRAIQEVGDEDAKMYMETLQVKVNDQVKFEERAQLIKDKKAILLNTLVRRLKNVGNNVESAQRAAKKILMDKSLNILSAEETNFIHNSKNDVDIMRALDDKPSSDIAKTIAKKIQSYIETRNSEEVNSGALLLSNLNKDRMFKAIHDAGKLLRGGRNLVQSALSSKYTTEAAKAIWKDFIRPLLHLEKTFEGTEAMGLDGNVDLANVDKMLDEIFDSITTGKPMLIGGGKKQEMFFDWKAATERHNDGNIFKSIKINQDRFKYSDQLADIFTNTAERLGYKKP